MHASAPLQQAQPGRDNATADKDRGDQANGFIDQRPQAIAQRRLQDMANNSPRAAQLKAIGQLAQGSAAPPIQRKRGVGAENPPPPYRAFIDPKKGGATYAAYADAQYEENKGRAERVIAQIHAGLIRRQTEDVPVAAGNYQPPDPAVWEVLPEPGTQIRGYGIKVEYNHKTARHDHSHGVSYQSTIKRDPDTKQIVFVAAANYAPTDVDKRASGDPHMKMNLNQIWASQIAYFTRLEQSDEKYGMREYGQLPPKLKSIKRSTVQNWSSLASYWITDGFGANGRIANADDWLAISGSPNGSALLYLIKDNPELGASLDPEAVAANPMSMYNIDITHAGPDFTFN